MSDWQLMADAPLHLDILGFGRMNDGSVFYAVGRHYGNGEFWDGEGLNQSGVVTHWMPLPEAPEVTP